MRDEDAGDDAPTPYRGPTFQNEPEAREDGYNTAALEVRPESAVQMQAIARERFELEAMISQARLYPRKEAECFQRMSTAAKRPSLAAAAEYRYQRGGKPVVGVSVKAARPLAMYWKYIRFGYQITRFDEDGFALRGFAHDVQEGSVVERPAEGRWLQQRKNRDTGKTEWMPVRDERERREMISKAGALAERNAILAVVPPDIVEDFIAECRKTNEAMAKGELGKNRQQTIRACAAAFGEFGVTAAMMEAKLGHALEQMSAEELADLRTIHNSLKEGEPASAFFDAMPKREVATVTIDLAQAKPAAPIDPPGGSALFAEGQAKPKPK